jgi:allantoate deiminase
MQEESMGIQIERMEKDLEAVNSFTSTPGKGITRFTFSQEYMKARDYLIAELRKIGAKVSTTVGGNLRGRLEGREKGSPSVMVGSHLDSVFQGGRFDGVAGVVCALEAARVVSEDNIVHRHPLDVVVFAEEEGSRFGSIMIGSRAWIGKLRNDDLLRLKDRDGISYVEAMERCGLVVEDSHILSASVVKAMIELHIEQSLVLESKGIQVGVVEGINGIKQFMVTLSGVANHAGATPMGLRHDALQGAARIIAEVERIASHEMGGNTVATVGYVSCEPGQANVIPGKVQFTVDIRDLAPKRLEEAVTRVHAQIEKTCGDRGLAFEIAPRSDTPPVTLSKSLVSLIEEAAKENGIKTLRMPSGALHDSSILPEITEVGMIFVPSKEGRSHCPEESTELSDLAAGAQILLAAALKLIQ